jgi:hypothetical protein
MFREAVNLEIDWGKYIIKDGILGLSDITIEKFVKSLADEAFRKIEENPIYSETNPFNWFNDWLDFNSTNERFFEGYKRLFSIHNDDNINYFKEGVNFKNDVLSLINEDNPYTIFFVDDIVFKNYFSLGCKQFKLFMENTDKQT